MKNPLKKKQLENLSKKIDKKNIYSTKISIIGKVAGKLGINKKFHKFQEDKIEHNKEFIISPVDANLVSTGIIKKDGVIISKSNKEISLREIIGEEADLFSGGFYLNFYLSPRDKHYWRMPYDCSLVSMSLNQGKARIPVIIGMDKIFKNKDFFKKAIKRNASISLVFKTNYFNFIMIPVGSLNVNGIHIIDEKNGSYKKGDIGGYFSIGSSMLLCFPKYELESLVKIGDSVKIGQNIIKIIKE
jgi:phosphatidylserine decarboxylase